jgi:hypothetical protein
MGFDEKDFGKKVKGMEMDAILMKHGKRMMKEVIPETREIIELEKRILGKVEVIDLDPVEVKSNINTPTRSGVDHLPLDSVAVLSSRINTDSTRVGFSPIKQTQIQPSVQTIPQTQIQTTTKDGKKRIRPILIAQNQNQPIQLKKAREKDTEPNAIKYILPLVMKENIPSVLQIPKIRSKFSITLKNQTYLESNHN